MRAAGLLALLPLLFAGCSAWVQAANDPKTQDLARLEGEWRVVVAEKDGREMPRLAGGIYTFQAGKMTILKRPDAKKLEANFKIDSTKSPAHIDWSYTNIEFPSSPGIYKFVGEWLILCYPITGVDRRPTDFDGDNLCFRLERVK